MGDERAKEKMASMRILPMMVAAAVVCSAATSCEGEKKAVVEGHNDPETTPTMLTRDIETMISDSGIMRYRITSPVWYVYEEARRPYWRFPKGIRLEKFNDIFQRDATVRADSAFYYVDTKIWELDGNVRVSNMTGEKFATNQLFWDQNSEKVYSDSFIHIERPDRVLEGYGFISNDRLTSYSIKRVSGIFPVESLRSAASDSANNPAPHPMPAH